MEFEPVLPEDIIAGVKYRVIFHSQNDRVWDGVFLTYEMIWLVNRYVFKASTSRTFLIPMTTISTVLETVSFNKIVKNAVVAKWKERTLRLVLKNLVDENYECDFFKVPAKRPIQINCNMKTCSAGDEMFLVAFLFETVY